jgi:hypothetical protein
MVCVASRKMAFFERKTGSFKHELDTTHAPILCQGRLCAELRALLTRLAKRREIERFYTESRDCAVMRLTAEPGALDMAADGNWDLIVTTPMGARQSTLSVKRMVARWSAAKAVMKIRRTSSTAS